MCTGNLSDGFVCDAIIRLTEIDAVEEIEELRPELEAGMFGDSGVLYDSKIRVEKARAAQNVPAGVAERSHGIGSKNRGVEVLLDQLSVGAAGIQLGLADTRSDKVCAIDAHTAV